MIVFKEIMKTVALLVLIALALFLPWFVFTHVPYTGDQILWLFVIVFGISRLSRIFFSLVE